MVRFTRELSHWDPETFVRTVLVEWLHVVEVWVGANFLFGHDRAGTFSVLRTLGARYGFRAEKIDPVRYKDFVVSSTRVRRLVTRGARGRGGRAARPSLFHRRQWSCAARAAAARSGFRPRTSRPPNELLPPAASTRRSPRSTASCIRR